MAELVYQFVDFDKISNIFVITCYKLVFSSKGLKANSGSYINIGLFVGCITFDVLFYLTGFNSFKQKVKDFMEKKYPNMNDSFETNESAYGMKNKSSNINDSNMKPEDFNDYEFNEFNYKEAKEQYKSHSEKIYMPNAASREQKNNKPLFFRIYRSQIMQNHIIISTFFLRNDYNSTFIKVCYLFFWLSLDMVTNALFFYDETMHRLYIDKGKYDFLYKLPIIIYPKLISVFLIKLFECFSLIQDDLKKIAKNKKNHKNKEELLKEIDERIYKFKRKFPIFLSIILLLFLLFWYYLSAFCAVFKNTQIPLLKDIVFGHIISLIAPFLAYFIPTYFRYLSMKAEVEIRGKAGFGIYKFLAFCLDFII